MVVTVFMRRTLKQRWFARRDDSRLDWAQVLDSCIKTGVLPVRRPLLQSRVEMSAAEAVLLERWTSSNESARLFLYSLFQHWGLLTHRLKKLRHRDRWERARSALILGKIGCLQAIPDIRHLLKRSGDVAFIQALEYLGNSSVIRPLFEVLTAKNGRQRTQPVIAALVRCAGSRPEQMLPYLKDTSPQLRGTAASVLAEIASANEVEGLIEAAEDNEAEVRSRVARALGRSGGLRAVPALQKLAEDPVWYVRLQAITALNAMRQVGVRKTYVRALEDQDWHVREKAALGLYHSIDNVAQLFAYTSQIPHGHEVLISTLDRHGITWEALGGLTSSNPGLENKSRALISNLLKGGRFSCVISAVNAHPDPAVRNQLALLINQNASPSVRLQCHELAELRESGGQHAQPAPRFAARE
jgi:hypothetical protein